MEFNARYAAATEYDQEFSITQLDGKLLGRCGVGFAAQIEDKPVAFDVWLQAEGNDHPQVAFLLTEYALNDDGIYHTLNGTGSPIEKLHEGLMQTLTAGSLSLEATVTLVEFGSETIDVFAQPTFFDRLFGREPQPMTVLTPHDYITRLAVRLEVTVQ